MTYQTPFRNFLQIADDYNSERSSESLRMSSLKVLFFSGVIF